MEIFSVLHFLQILRHNVLNGGTQQCALYKSFVNKKTCSLRVRIEHTTMYDLVYIKKKLLNILSEMLYTVTKKVWKRLL